MSAPKQSTFTCDQGDTFSVPGVGAQPTNCPFCGSPNFSPGQAYVAPTASATAIDPNAPVVAAPIETADTVVPAASSQASVNASASL